MVHCHIFYPLLKSAHFASHIIIGSGNEHFIILTNRKLCLKRVSTRAYKVAVCSCREFEMGMLLKPWISYMLLKPWKHVSNLRYVCPLILQCTYSLKHGWGGGVWRVYQGNSCHVVKLIRDVHRCRKTLVIEIEHSLILLCNKWKYM